MLADRRSLIESTFPTLERDLFNEFRLGMQAIIQGETAEGATRFKKGK
jgi:hypothetical protein